MEIGLLPWHHKTIVMCSCFIILTQPCNIYFSLRPLEIEHWRSSLQYRLHMKHKKSTVYTLKSTTYITYNLTYMTDIIYDIQLDWICSICSIEEKVQQWKWFSSLFSLESLFCYFLLFNLFSYDFEEDERQRQIIHRKQTNRPLIPDGGYIMCSKYKDFLPGFFYHPSHLDRLLLDGVHGRALNNIK